MRSLILFDILFLPAKVFRVGFRKYTFICMNIKSTKTVPYLYDSCDAGLVRDSTVARNNYLRYLAYDRFQQRICNPFKLNNLLVLTCSFNDFLIDSRTHNIIDVLSCQPVIPLMQPKLSKYSLVQHCKRVRGMENGKYTIISMRQSKCEDVWVMP